MLRHGARCTMTRIASRNGLAVMGFPDIGKFPGRRMRRMRRDEFSRRLMREHRLTSDDLIYPVFVVDGNRREEPVPSLPGISRRSIDLLLGEAERCAKLAIP